MVDIYSRPLGAVNVTDAGVLHTLYTVPLDGPAVVRSFSVYADVGALVYLGVNDGSANHWLGVVDAVGAANPVCATFLAYQPLEPGSSIVAINNAGGSAHWTATAGGYQFSS